MSVFSDLAGQFLTEEYEARPVTASALGLTEYDDRLPDLSEAEFERRADASAAWLERFSQLSTEDLTFEEAIDRDLLLASLKERRIYDEWEVWRRHPDTYLNPSLRGVFGLFLHRLAEGEADIPTLVRAIYLGLDPRLVRAAGLSVLAHLEDLVARGLVATEGEPSIEGRYRLV